MCYEVILIDICLYDVRTGHTVWYHPRQLNTS